jgi:hypothetical protein
METVPRIFEKYGVHKEDRHCYFGRARAASATIDQGVTKHTQILLEIENPVQILLQSFPCTCRLTGGQANTVLIVQIGLNLRSRGQTPTILARQPVWGLV